LNRYDDKGNDKHKKRNEKCKQILSKFLVEEEGKNNMKNENKSDNCSKTTYVIP